MKLLKLTALLAVALNIGYAVGQVETIGVPDMIAASLMMGISAFITRVVQIWRGIGIKRAKK